MRSGEKGMKYIDDMMKKFEAKHATHIKLYGTDNDKRLTGIHETSSMDKFSYGAGNRACSFRIPTCTVSANGKGYVEDRRPASNVDPYIASAIVFDTGVLPQSKAGPMIEQYDKWTAFIKT